MNTTALFSTALILGLTVSNVSSAFTRDTFENKMKSTIQEVKEQNLHEKTVVWVYKGSNQQGSCQVDVDLTVNQYNFDRQAKVSVRTFTKISYISNDDAKINTSLDCDKYPSYAPLAVANYAITIGKACNLYRSLPEVENQVIVTQTAESSKGSSMTSVALQGLSQDQIKAATFSESSSNRGQVSSTCENMKLVEVKEEAI